MDRLSTEGIDQRIDEFRTLLDRVTGHLVELDADLTWQLLEQSTSLRGRTAERWSDASRRHEALWRGQFALAGHLERLSSLRGSRRSLPRAVLVELDELLEGSVVRMPASPEASSTALTEPLDHTELTSVDVALRAMSDDYGVVALLVSEVAEVWGLRCNVWIDWSTRCPRFAGSPLRRGCGFRTSSDKQPGRSMPRSPQ